jgi:hypothetical protein
MTMFIHSFFSCVIKLGIPIKCKTIFIATALKRFKGAGTLVVDIFKRWSV